MSIAPPPAERIEWHRPPDLPGVEVLRAERCGRIWRVYHETYTICAVLDISGGETEWTYRGKLHSARAGGLMLMEPGEVHAMPHAIPPCDFRVVLIAPSLAAEAAREMGMASLQPHLRFAHVAAPELFRTYLRFHLALEGKSSSLERESLLAACVQSLFAHCTEMASHPVGRTARSILSRARDLIQEHYSRAIHLEELAAATGLSRFHLARAFTREFGIPPHAYQIRVQAAKARSLLAAGVPPAQVAAEAGFADQSHLARHFKAIYGITPGEYGR